VTLGNGLKGERVADGSVLAMNWGNARGAKGPCCWYSSKKMGGRGGMIKTSIKLHDLRWRIYAKAKADSAGTGGVGNPKALSV